MFDFGFKKSKTDHPFSANNSKLKNSEIEIPKSEI
jgi:hypothetical protein